MTFVAYARARRMGIALKQIRQGSSVIQAQVTQGYQSASGFRDAFSKILGDSPNRFQESALLARWIDTTIGSMLAIAGENHLHLLEFTDRRGLEREVERLRQKTQRPILPGNNHVWTRSPMNCTQYFTGSLRLFRTPLELLGTPVSEKGVARTDEHTLWCATQLRRSSTSDRSARRHSRRGAGQWRQPASDHRSLPSRRRLQRRPDWLRWWTRPQRMVARTRKMPTGRATREGDPSKNDQLQDLESAEIEVD